MKMYKTNKAICLRCGTIIESRHTHDFQTCQCGDVSVDGGKFYLKRTLKKGAKWKELSEEENGPENKKH